MKNPDTLVAVILISIGFILHLSFEETPALAAVGVLILALLIITGVGGGLDG